MRLLRNSKIFALLVWDQSIKIDSRIINGPQARKKKLIMNLLTKIFGTKNDKIIKKDMMPIVAKINAIESTISSLSDEELRGKTDFFRNEIQNGKSLDSLLVEAFAVCREAAKRTLGQRHYDVQLIGGIVLHRGNIAEMKTGEGKTQTAALPAYLHGLSGKGAHVVTVNDYLAERDAEWMGRIYGFLGLTTGVVKSGMSDAERKEAYACDITYATNNEVGFDFLRDNMKTSPDALVQRGFNFAIVDEVDSILIDEARTPLIISGPAETNLELFTTVNRAIPGLQKDSDYMVDEKSRSVTLTEDGISKLEKRLKVDNLYDPANIQWLHHTNQALKAHVMFKKDVDYVVKNNQVIIVDEHTGRLMAGRRYSDGLHGALEAKEGVTVQRETQTMATITFQNLFRMYSTLSGMTGTADTEAVEFKKIYNLDVVVVPTNKPIAREDRNDVVYRTAREKFDAIADEIAQSQKRGQPVLVGTVSVEKSELLSSLLNKRGVSHEILNAKNHAREAEIIAKAGHQGQVTIATSMAGRGTDIKLGEGVLDLGGLYVISTERHESRRIDNQLRGRSGRQGDVGKSQFFLSLEDDLMRIFASDRVSGLMKTLGMEEGEAIVSPMVTRAIEKAQKRVEEQNFASRKHLLEYDDVMNQQRQVIYGLRNDALKGESDVEFINEMTAAIGEAIALKYSPEKVNSTEWDLTGLEKELHTEFGFDISLAELKAADTNQIAVGEIVKEACQKHLQEKFDHLTPEDRTKVYNYIFLQIIDHSWKNHLLAMDGLKDSVSLRGYGQRDPLQEYKKEAFKLFELLVGKIEEETTLALLRMPKPELNLTERLREDFEDDDFEYDHPDSSSGAEGQQNDDGMIYYGSRDDEPAEEKAQPFVREGQKVGRNDPCPCGSGKKYKKCHGKLGT